MDVWQPNINYKKTFWNQKQRNKTNKNSVAVVKTVITEVMVNIKIVFSQNLRQCESQSFQGVQQNVEKVIIKKKQD